MTEVNYALYTIMSYATSFLFVYILQFIYDLYNDLLFKFKPVIGGLVFGLSLSMSIFIAETLHLTPFPNGRFTIVMLSSSFFGPIGGFVTGSLIYVVSITNNYYETTFLCLNIIQHFAIGLIIYFITKKSLKVKMLLNIVGSIVGIAIASILAKWTVTEALSDAIEIRNNLIYVIPLVATFAFTISMVVAADESKRKRVKNLNNNKKHLEIKNSEINELNNQLYDSENKYKMVLKASDEGFLEYNHFTKIIVLSEKAMKIMDHIIHSREMTLWDAFDILEPSDAKLLRSGFDLLKTNDKEMYDIVLRVKQRNGEYKHIKFTGIVIRLENKVMKIVGSIKDINSQIIKEKMIFDLAYRDEITKLFNENALLKDLNEQVSKNRRENLLFLTIRGFEGYSSIGIDFKNGIKLHFRDVLKKYFHISSCYYLSGGHFVIRMLSDVTFEEAAVKYKAVSNEISKPVKIGDVTIPIFIHGNYLNYPLKDVSTAGLINRGRSMLDHLELSNMKKLSIFNEDIYNSFYRSKNLDSFILSGLKSNEFYMMYQPQYDANSRVVGYEALIRWDSSQLGFVSPVEFIPLSEKHGSIHQIGYFVVESVIDFMKAYKTTYTVYPRISVNVSFVELISPVYADELTKRVRESGIPISNLIIEITETAISEFLDIVISNISILVQNGFEIHLDDFGTGYSSLSHLSKLDVSTVKIDKMFIDDLAYNMTTRNIVLSIIELSHRIGKKVIAEGIEKEEQFNVLKSLDCDEYQGYYFAKPLNDHVILKV